MRIQIEENQCDPKQLSFKPKQDRRKKKFLLFFLEI